MPAVADVIFESRGRVPVHNGKGCWIWELEGSPAIRFIRRFGGPFDVSFFHVLRYIAVADAIWVPFFLSFGTFESRYRVITSHGFFTFADVTFNVIYGLGCLSQLRTSIVDPNHGVEFIMPSRIFEIRATTVSFWLDVVSLLSGCWLFTGIRQLQICRLFRLWRLSSSADDLYELHYTAFESEDTGGRFMSLFGKMWLFMHTFACAWFGVMAFEMEDVDSWIRAEPRWMGGHLETIYIRCFADSAALVFGWAGPEPAGLELTHTESAFYCIAAPCAGLFNAYVVSQVVSLIASSSQETARHLHKMAPIASTVDAMMVPDHLKRMILRYHCYCSVHNLGDETHAMVEEGLSHDLREQIRLYMFEHLVQNCYFLQDVPSGILVKMVMGFKEKAYAPGDLVIRKGEVGGELFFVLKGYVNVLTEDCIVLAILGRNEHFGEVALVQQTVRTASVCAGVFCIIGALTQEVFEAAVGSDSGLKRRLFQSLVSTRAGSNVPGSADYYSTNGVYETTPLLSAT
eukprot:gnl/TRDRNA2_/TRDRNA2_129365_c0_seq2.p1 gnl/TRDRNA2_/TRDRNA2_129365_c0~~gnl/TRDRNA2_/TRDRNA2_129365_c0_seq2.p1  ORF type:complete len:528 (-),score=51.74 gnl/TRDRNA2_/TRDRNA2_129365_c0_seq2:216-1760(-)